MKVPVHQILKETVEVDHSNERVVEQIALKPVTQMGEEDRQRFSISHSKLRQYSMQRLSQDTIQQ